MPSDYTYDAYRQGMAAYYSGAPMPRYADKWDAQAFRDGYEDARRDCPDLALVCAGVEDDEEVCA